MEGQVEDDMDTGSDSSVRLIVPEGLPAATATTGGTFAYLRHSGFLALSLFVIGPLVVGVWHSLWGLVHVAMNFRIFSGSCDQQGDQGGDQNLAGATPELWILTAVMLLGLPLQLLAKMAQTEIGYLVLKMQARRHQGPLTTCTFLGQVKRHLLVKAACFSFSVINLVISALVCYCMFSFLSGTVGSSSGFRGIALILVISLASCAGVFCFRAGYDLVVSPLSVMNDSPLSVFWTPALSKRVLLESDGWEESSNRFKKTISIPVLEAPPRGTRPTFARFLADDLPSTLCALLSIVAWWGLWTLMDEMDQHKVLNLLWNVPGIENLTSAAKTQDLGPIANSTAPNEDGAQQQASSLNLDWITIVFGQGICAAAYFMQVPLASAFTKELAQDQSISKNRHIWLVVLHNCLILMAMVGCVQFWKGIWNCLDMWAPMPNLSCQEPNSLVFNYVVKGTIFTVALLCLGCFQTSASRGVSSTFDNDYTAPFDTTYEHPWLQACCAVEKIL